MKMNREAAMAYTNDAWGFGCGEPFCVHYWFELPDMPGEADEK